MFLKGKWPPEAAWVALAFVLRLGFAFKLGSGFYQTDEGGFFAASLNLALHGILGLGDHAEVMPPVPSAFYALFYRLFGPDKLFPRLGQAAVSAATAWAIGRMTREVSGSERAGRLALAVSAVYPFFIYYSGILLSETLYLAALVPGLWLLWRSVAEGGRSPRTAGLAGGLLAAAALCRAEGAPILLVIWLIMAGACALGRWRFQAWGAAVLCWLIPLVAWCARNKAVSGRFALDLHGGMTLLHGTLLFEHNEIDTSFAQQAVEKMEFYKNAQGLDEAERDKAYWREGVRFMRDNPGAVLRQWTRKFVNFWRFYPRADKAFLENRFSNPGAGLGRRGLALVSLLFEPWLILLGLAGLWGLRRRWSAALPLWLFLLGTMGVHMISVSQMRYRLPVMPLLILGSCALLAEAFERRLTPPRR